MFTSHRPAAGAIRLPLALLASAALLSLAPVSIAQQRGGQLYEVPAEEAAKGKVYRVHPVKDAQMTFTSDAPLEHIKGSSNQVNGYCVAPTDDSGKLEAEIITGEFRLPVASIDTGIPMRNEHMQGERWMHAESHADIVFKITGAEDASVAKEDEWFTTYDVTLLGDMTVRGVTKELRIPARLTFMPESDKTKARAPGDLLAIRAQFPIKLSDFSIAKGDQAIESGMVSNDLTIDTFLMLTTFDPTARTSESQSSR